MNTLIKVLIAFLLIPFFGYAQDSVKQNVVVVISMAEGDLNNDGIVDLAIVTQDTLEEYRPYLLEIFLRDERGISDLVVQSHKAIMPQYPNGEDGYRSGIGFAGLVIEDGSLRIENQLLRGHFEHTFRFRKKQFELIRHTYVSADGLGKLYEIDFNLATGELKEYQLSYINDEVFKDTTTIVQLSKLPLLTEFEPFKSEFF